MRLFLVEILRLFALFGGLFIASGTSSEKGFIVSPASLKPTQYQRWAHYNFVWLHNSQGNQDNFTALVQGYQDHNIPIGAVNIDSTWATEFNNFVVDTNKFQDFPGLISNFHERGLKAILWVTSMVNVENPDYQMCVDNKFLVRDKMGIVRPMKWWHGSGGLLDYSNPDALAWWHTQMDKVLDVGIDGFKTDGTDPYIIEYILAGGALGYNDQPLTYRDYASAYYTDFLTYTRQKRSDPKAAVADAGLVMGRPVDCEVDKVTKVCWEFGVKPYSYSYWVGDDDGTWNGLRGCARKILYSAYVNYVNMGCDTGGYRNKGTDRQLFTRWAQFNAFLPLFENGGGGEHRPWMFDEEVTDIYRSFAHEHHRLSQYLLTTGADAIDSQTSSITPLDKETGIEINEKIAELVNNHTYPGITFPEPKSFAYYLGNDLLVYPIMMDVLNETDRNFAIMPMKFPTDKSGNNVRWLNYWAPFSSRRSHVSGESAVEVYPFSEYPVFIRQNALIPMMTPAIVKRDTNDVSGDYSHTVFTWFAPDASKSDKIVYNMRESVTEGSTGLTGTAQFTDASTVSLTISAHSSRSAGFSVVGISEPSDITVESWPLAGCVNHYFKLTKTWSVDCENIKGGLSVTLKGVSLDI